MSEIDLLPQNERELFFRAELVWLIRKIQLLEINFQLILRLFERSFDFDIPGQ